jgi:hypothetical protein
MNKDYNFYLEQEVLSEFTSEILSEFSRYFIENDIDISDKTNPIVIINNKLCELKLLLYTDKIKNTDDLKVIEEKFLFSKSILKELSLKVA